MILWEIRYWIGHGEKSPLKKWLLELPQEHFKYVTKEMNLLEELGNELRLPHSRSLGEGLFELRERKYGYRIYYAFEKTKVIILLAAGNKKSQKRDIEVARERLVLSIKRKKL